MCVPGASSAGIRGTVARTPVRPSRKKVSLCCHDGHSSVICCVELVVCAVPLGTASLSSSANSTSTPVSMRKFQPDELPVIKVSSLPAGAGVEENGLIGSVEHLGDGRSVDSGLVTSPRSLETV